MGRPVSGNMATILAGTDRKVDHTIAITFPDASVLRYATSPLTISSQTYTNDLENIREIRQSIESAVDRVGIALQNKDRVLSTHLAVNWLKWRKAEAVIGRYYRGGTNFGTTEWIEMFRGVVQQPEADDLQFTFEVVHDTVAPGGIVCNTTEDPMCPNVFKDPETCGYVGAETLCDHHLKSKGGCDGRDNAHRFRGMEHRYNPDVTPPGAGGNPGGDDPGEGPPCPRKDQFVRVRNEMGQASVCVAEFVTDQDWLWHPIKRRFFRIRNAELVRDQPIWESVSANGAVGYSSHPHPLIPYREHVTGIAASDCITGDPILTEIEGDLNDSKLVISQDTGELGDVVRIVIDADDEADKIYAYGDSPLKLLVCHNRKLEP